MPIMIVGCDINCDILGRPVSKQVANGDVRKSERKRYGLYRGPMIVQFIYRWSNWPRSPFTDPRKSRCHRLFEQIEHVRASEQVNERTNEAAKYLLSLHTRHRYLKCCNFVVVVAVLSSFMHQLKRARRQLRFNSL